VFVSIRDVRGSLKDQRWIQSVYGEYLESLADLNTGFFSVIGSAENARQDEIFANWFSNDQTHPLVISKGTDPVGFALVTRLRIAPAEPKVATYRMSEFFVRRPHRQAGIGRNAATLIFDRFAGDWEIVEYLRHPGSVAFWRRVLTVYCPGNFSERAQNGEVLQRFKSRPSPTR
jgi:predicted acetyltransferase